MLNANNGRLAHGNALLAIGTDGNVKSIVNIAQPRCAVSKHQDPVLLLPLKRMKSAHKADCCGGFDKEAEKTPARKFKNVGTP